MLSGIHAKRGSLVPLPVADLLRHQPGLHQDQHPHHSEGDRQGAAICLCHLGSHSGRELAEHRRRHHTTGQVQANPVELDGQWLLHRVGRLRCPLQDRLCLRRAVRPCDGNHLDASSLDSTNAPQVQGLDSSGVGSRCSVSPKSFPLISHVLELTR